MECHRLVVVNLIGKHLIRVLHRIVERGCNIVHSSRVKDRIRTRQKTDVSTQHIARKDNEEG
jgi:hypothetical protein